MRSAQPTRCMPSTRSPTPAAASRRSRSVMVPRWPSGSTTPCRGSSWRARAPRRLVLRRLARVNQARHEPGRVASVISIDPPGAIGRPCGTFMLAMLPDTLLAAGQVRQGPPSAVPAVEQRRAARPAAPRPLRRRTANVPGQAAVPRPVFRRGPAGAPHAEPAAVRREQPGQPPATSRGSRAISSRTAEPKLFPTRVTCCRSIGRTSSPTASSASLPRSSLTRRG